MDRLNKRLAENGSSGFLRQGTGAGIVIPKETLSPSEPDGLLESWLTALEIKFRGGITEDADDFQKRLVNSPKPSYRRSRNAPACKVS